MDLKAFCFIVLAGSIPWACLCCAADSDHTQTMPRFRPSVDYATVETDHQAFDDAGWRLRTVDASIFRPTVDMSRIVPRPDDAKQKKTVQRILLLLEEGDYEQGLKIAEVFFEDWRSYQHAVKAAYGDTAIGILIVNQEAQKYERDMLAGIRSIKDAAAIPHLLNTSVKELAYHAYQTAINIALTQNESEKAVTTSKVLRAWEETIGDNYNAIRVDTMRSHLAGGCPELLLDLYNDSRDWRMNITREIVWAAAKGTPQPGYIANVTTKYPKSFIVLVAAISDHDPGIRQFAAARLRKSNAYIYWEDEQDIIQALIGALDDDCFMVQMQAAMSLASYAALEGLRHIIASDISDIRDVQDPASYHWQNQWTTALVLMGDFHFTEATDWMVDAGRRYPQIHSLYEALRSMRDTKAVEFLGEIVRSEYLDKNPNTYGVAIQALARTMDDSAFPHIKEAYKKAKREHNAQAVRTCLAALAWIHPDMSFDILCDALSYYWPIRNDPEITEFQQAFGTALYQLRKSGFPDPVKQLNISREDLRNGMVEYWAGKKSLLDAWDRVRSARFIENDPEAENLAWHALKQNVDSAPLSVRRMAVQRGMFGLEFDSSAELTSRDESLIIHRSYEECTLFLIVNKNE